MKIGYYQNPKMWEGDAAGVGSYGVLTEIDGVLFIDDIPLIAYLKDHIGKKGMFEFVFPEQPEYEIDEKIKPLVEAMQRKGIKTMGSCEGHFPAEKNLDRPYVSFYGKFWFGKPKIDGWIIEKSPHHDFIYVLATKERAHSEEKLKELHAMIDRAVRYFSV